MNSDEDQVKQLLTEFFAAAHKWGAHYGAQLNAFTPQHATTMADSNADLKIIYDRYATPKDRKRSSMYNVIAWPSEYDPKTEDIVSVTKKHSGRIEVETIRRNMMRHRYKYVFLKKHDQWLIDSRQLQDKSTDKWLPHFL